MDPQKDQQPTDKPEKGYGKRPTWQWILIYAIAGGIIYWLVYYLVFAGDEGGGSVIY